MTKLVCSIFLLLLIACTSAFGQEIPIDCGECPQGTHCNGWFPPSCESNGSGDCPGACYCTNSCLQIRFTPVNITAMLQQINAERLNVLINSALYTKKQVVFTEYEARAILRRT